MPDTPNTSIAGNLRWFALVYAGALIAIAVVLYVAEQFGVQLPASGASIGAFAGVTVIAGQRFAQRRGFNWSSRDRHQLSLGYVALATVISVALLGVLIAIEPSLGAELVELWRSASMFLIGGMLVAMAIYYGMARLMLRFAANRGQRQ